MFRVGTAVRNYEKKVATKEAEAQSTQANVTDLVSHLKNCDAAEETKNAERTAVAELEV